MKKLKSYKKHQIMFKHIFEQSLHDQGISDISHLELIQTQQSTGMSIGDSNVT